MHLNFVIKISWFIISGLIEAAPCRTVSQKNHFGKNINSDTIPKKILLDTSLQFNSITSLNDYLSQAQRGLKAYSKDIMYKQSDSIKVRYILDSLHSLNSEFESFLLYKYLKSSEKSLNSLIAFYNFVTPSKLVTATDQMALFEMYPESIKKSANGKKMYSKIYTFNVLNEGKIEDFILANTFLKTLKGRTISAKHIFSRKKYEFYLIIFGASWCAPCRRENTYLNSNMSKIDTSKVKIIGLSIDNDALAWKNSIIKDDCKWENFLLKSGQESLLYKKNISEKIPFNILVNFDGKIAQNHYDIRVVLESLPLTVYTRTN